MSDLKACPFCGSGAIEVSAWEDHTTIGCLDCDYGIRCQDCDEEDAVDWWNTRPAEDALKAEVEKLKSDLAIQKNLTNQACFESNRAYQETEKWKKRFYDLIDKQSSVSTDPKVIIVGKDINVPANAPDTNVGTKGGEA